MKSLTCIVIIIVFTNLHIGFGQPKNAVKERDSLMALIPTLTNDTLRVNVLHEVSEAWMGTDPIQSLKYMEEALALAKKINSKPHVVGAMISLGYRYSVFGEPVKAIKVLQEVKRMTNDSNAIAVSNTFIGLVFQSQNDFENALKYEFLGYNYHKSEYVKGSRTQEVKEGYTGTTMGIGEIYLLMERMDSAFHFLKESYKLMKEEKANRYFAHHIPLLLGQAHLKNKELGLAFTYLHEALQSAKNLEDGVGICESQAALAQYYELIQRPDSMSFYALLALPRAQKIKRYETVSATSALLKKWYQDQNNLTKAIYYNDIAFAAQDSLRNSDKIKQAQQLIFQEEQYQLNLDTEKNAYRNRLLLYGLVLGLCVLALLAYILYLNFKRKQKETLLLSNEIKLQESAFNHKIVETEMTALRAQMNPHFIFNCLNSIKLHTLENNPIVASDYLTKFSKLIRLVLENSRSEKVTLANELDMLRLYMEMEAMRFKDKMQFKINVEADLDTHFIEIPPLLLQPYIENAIWHGLMHKEEGGNVILEIETKDEQTLLIAITDDGIGRKAAAELKSKTATQNKSFGLKMTSERIGLINQLYKSETQVQIEDLTDTHGNAKGTKVTLEIPI
jgi:Histidine kinase